MPNGADRDFVRFISCIASFKAKFNSWPTRIRVDPDFVRELREVMTPQDYQKMSQKIKLIPDNSNPFDGTYIAEDEDGDAYDLLRERHGRHGYEKRHVLDWLGIEWPDYGED